MITFLQTIQVEQVLGRYNVVAASIKCNPVLVPLRLLSRQLHICCAYAGYGTTNNSSSLAN